MRRIPLLALAATGILVGLPVRAPIGHAQSTGRYMVAFKGQMPNDLDGRVAALGGTVADVLPDMKFAVVDRLSDSAAAALAAQPDVADMAEDELVVAPQPLRGPGTAALPQTAPAPASAANPAAASMFPYQWNMRAIRADRAWQAGFLGSPAVTVAMIDTGADPTHFELVDHLDTARSTATCTTDRAIVASEFPGYPLWTDLAGHGTWTASFVSSSAHVVAGVTSRTTLIAVKALSITPCFSSSVFRAIYYATQAGADVLNLSLGTPVAFPKSGTHGFHRFYKYAAQYALVKGASAVVVAAGNFSIDIDHDGSGFVALCDVPGVICVSATGPIDSGPDFLGPFTNVDAFAFYSNYGASAINVAAPGGNGVLNAAGDGLDTAGWMWGACASTDREFDSSGHVIPGYCTSHGYTIEGSIGTSAAAPHVSGLAALLVDRLGHQQKAQVQAAISQSADDRGKPGNDPFYGAGRINVARALGVK